MRHPRLTFKGVCRATGLAVGTASHHLATLRGHGQVVAFAHGNRIRFFPDGWTPAAAAIEALRLQPVLRRVLDALGRERLFQKEVLARAGLPRSTTQHALGRLVRAGAVRVMAQGRYLCYEVA